MRIKQVLCILFFLLSSGLIAIAQGQITNEEYIDRFKRVAMQKMQEYKIPASITLAQGILESGSGNSNLAVQANNHFGIKCHGWTGRTFYMDDDEKNECFRAYDNPEESYHDHSLFLTMRPRYATLFDLDIMDYKAWAKGLSKAGYATNPRYPELLVRIIERNELYLYDQQAIGGYIARAETDQVTPVHKPTHQQTREVFEPQLFEVVGYSPQGRPIHLNNNCRLIIARNGDSFHSIAHEFSIFGWQIAKYNELDKRDNPVEGQILYLQRKRGKSQTHENHTVSVGESVHGISQLYGVRMKVLQRRNNLPDGVQPVAGTVLKLR
jgi:hypothetical protein